METCGTCRFWGRKDAFEDNEYRTCTAIIHDEDSLTDGDILDNDRENIAQAAYYDWLSPEEAENRASEVREFRKHNLAVVKDGSGYFAALKTKDSFGCILHKPMV